MTPTLHAAAGTAHEPAVEVLPESEAVRHLVEHAAHLLPAQGPITVFVHHNTLHAFEALPFDVAVAQGGKTYSCHPYLSEERYQEKIAQGRIRVEDLSAELLEDLGDHADLLVGNFGTRFHLRLAMLIHPLQVAPAAELRWFVAENNALRKFRSDAPPAIRDQMIDATRRWVMRDLRNGGRYHAGGGDQRIQAALAGVFDHFGRDSMELWTRETWESFTLHALWRACRGGVHGVRSFAPPHRMPLRHRDVLLEATGEDSDQLIHDVLIRFCAAYLDQGVATWSPPNRDQGFYESFRAVYAGPGRTPHRWLRGLRAEFERLDSQGLTPAESIAESLRLLGVPPDQWEAYLSANLLALRGWAGMIWQMETRPDRVAHPVPPGTLIEFLAVRLVLKRLALAWIAAEQLDFHGPLSELKAAARSHVPGHDSVNLDQRAFLAFQLAQVLGWKPRDLFQLPKQQWTSLVQELEQFSSLERRRIYQRAFERRYRIATLDALAIRSGRPPSEPARPVFQMITCIDEREESFRRHLEEVFPEVQTFGAAGFFSVAMYYRGAADAHFVPLCPVVIRPQHFVAERVDESLADSDLRRGRLRRWLGRATHTMHLGSRTFTIGALLALIVGPLASIPLVLRILFPRAAAQVGQRTGQFVQPPNLTRLDLERHDPDPGPDAGHLGFTREEMANIVERLLRDIGLTSGFSRLVVVAGHGSSSLNNPHSSAYDCGACGGGRGGPNARAFARLANDPEVRKLLIARGIAIPADTVFLGGMHNTCDDSVTYSDLDLLPATHLGDLARAKTAIDEARARNAHERSRRFVSAPLTLSFDAALRHVEERSADLSQTRPECGHATNAVCLVGRRARTRDLYLDRRTFLVSYDPLQDDAQTSILARILGAVVPVCAGINLEYYFSYVDPVGWGCGTKLPHNITSLLGVMDGTASDLRPGLPWQMVEIHEPIRLLFVMETTPAAVLRIMEQNPLIATHIRNGWVQVATLDPESSRIHVYRQGRFVVYHAESRDLPVVGSSVEWYGGWREHLDFALVTPQPAGGPASAAPTERAAG